MFCVPCDCPPAMVCYQRPDQGDCPDGVVDATDMLVVLVNWGACADIPCLGPTGMCCEVGDIDRDGIVGVTDLLLVFQWWGPFDVEAWREWRCQ